MCWIRSAMLQLGQHVVGGVVVRVRRCPPAAAAADQRGRARAAPPGAWSGSATQPRTTGISEPERGDRQRRHHPVARPAVVLAARRRRRCRRGPRCPRRSPAGRARRRGTARPGRSRSPAAPARAGSTDAALSARCVVPHVVLPAPEAAPSPRPPPPSAGGRPSSAGRAPAPRGGRRGRAARAQATQRVRAAVRAPYAPAGLHGRADHQGTGRGVKSRHPGLGDSNP